MKNKYVLLLINIVIYTYSCVVVYGNTTKNTLALEKFTTLNGLSDNHINDLYKDKNGFVWIATDFGVTRFDGVHFNKLDDLPCPPLFKNKKVEAIHVFGNQLLFQVKNTGIISFDPATSSFKIITDSPVRKICVVNQSIYYYKDNGFLYEYRANDHLTSYFIGKLNYFEFNLQKDGLYFLIRNKGFIKFHLATKKVVFQMNANELFSDISYPINSPKNLFLRKNTIYEISTTGKIAPSNYYTLDEQVTFFGFDLKNEPIYILKTKTIKYKSLDFNNLINRFQLQDHELRKIIQVDPKTYFVLTNQGLLKFSLKKQISEKINISKIVNPNDIQVRRRIIPVSANEQLYLGYPGIIHVIGGERHFTNYENRPLPCYDGIKIGNTIYIISEGAGLFKYDLPTKKLTKIITPTIGSLSNFDAIAPYKNGLVLVSEEKIVFYDPITLTEKTVFFTKKQTPYCVKHDTHLNQLLIGTKDKLLIYNVINENQLCLYKTISTSYEIRDILISKNGQTLNLATSNGYYRFNRVTYSPIFHYSDHENKSNNLVCTVNEAKNGSIWLTTFSGILHYTPSNNKLVVINQKNGLHNIEYNYKAAAWLGNDLYVGGLNNYEVIHTALFKTKTRENKLYLSSYTINSFTEKEYYLLQPNSTKTSINYRTDNQELTLHFSNINLAEASTLPYKYKINNGAWMSMKNGTIRFAYLPYGRYELTVQIINQLDTQIALKNYTIVAEIPFYKKQVFFITLLVILLLFFVLIIFLFIQRTRVIEATKKRIAMDLHDEAGTILTRTLLFVRMNNQKGKTAFTEKIESNIQELLFSIRAFMSSLSIKNATSYLLGDELQEFFYKNSQESDRIFLFTNLIQHDITISNEMYRDIKLCIYEITNNFIKHSNGEKLTVFLQMKSNNISLLFEDSGTNFDPKNTRSGNGLRNINKRTERNKGTFKIEKQGDNSIFSIIFPI